MGSLLFLSYENLILDSDPASGHRDTEDGDDGDDGEDGEDDDVGDDAGVHPLRLLLLLRLLQHSHVEQGHDGADL